MYLGRVVGCVWSSAKDPHLQGQRLLIVQPITPERRDSGKPLICADSTGAGAGETIYWVRGKEASFPFQPTEVPVDTTIVGIVDSIHVKKESTPPPVSSPEPPKSARNAARKGRRC